MNALESWIHCQPSPRFVWRDVASHAGREYRERAGGYYAPMNCYRAHGDRVLRRVVLVVEGAK